MKLVTQGLENLSESGQLKIEALIEQYPNEGDMLKIQAFANLDTTDEEEVPAGLVTIYSTKSKVSVDSIPEKSFNYLVVCPIEDKNETLQDSDFPIDQRLHEAAPQYSDKPPSLHNRAQNNLDMNSWNAELGEDGFAGIYKKVKENGRGADYFVVVQAGVSRACAELKDYLHKNPDVTFDDLLKDKRYGYVRALAQRNAQRLAYNVARAYKVPIAHMRDISSFRPEGEDHVGQPMRAATQDNMMQAQSTIKLMPQGHRNQSAVAVYHNVRPMEESNQICYVVSNPYDGLAVFNMRGTGEGIGLPANTGRKLSQGLDMNIDKKRSRGMTWEQQDSLKQHSDLHPEAFNRIDDKFLEHMKSLGWKQEGTNNREYLVPVAVKLSHPDVKR